MPDKQQIEQIKACIEALNDADCSDTEEMHRVVNDASDFLCELQAELQIEIDEEALVALAPPLVDPNA